jgi:hypothetical protein
MVSIILLVPARKNAISFDRQADAGNGHGSTHDTTTTGPKDAGKKTPDQLLTQNTKLSDNL